MFALENNTIIITTEKDFVKLESCVKNKHVWFYLPVEFAFTDKEDEFLNLLNTKINRYKNK